MNYKLSIKNKIQNCILCLCCTLYMNDQLGLCLCDVIYKVSLYLLSQQLTMVYLRVVCYLDYVVTFTLVNNFHFPALYCQVFHSFACPIRWLDIICNCILLQLQWLLLNMLSRQLLSIHDWSFSCRCIFEVCT